MVHTEQPLQEKMALFWHNHFATAYTKIAGAVGAVEATRMMAAKPSEDPGKVRGQIELFREQALGNFRDLVLEVAKDPAMLVWLDGRTNFRARPQENFARELMELFTMGVGRFAEADVYAAARVFTGWNLQRVGGRDDPAARYQFFYDARQHDTNAKEFTFAIYPDGGRVIQARSADQGMQDGVDLINAVVSHPATGRRLARKLWAFFVSELHAPPDEWVEQIAAAFYESGFNMRLVMRRVLGSPEFRDESVYFTRYSWPVEFVARMLKEVGWAGFSVNDTLAPLNNMGMALFDPPDVNGWETGGGWYSTGAMLARMNFAAQLSGNQRFNLRDASRGQGPTPEAFLSFFLDRLSPADLDRPVYDELLGYLRAGGAWTGADAQRTTKGAGLVHLVCGSSEYQFV
jgi:uncharacterized protein (DUF1800 family)